MNARRLLLSLATLVFLAAPVAADPPAGGIEEGKAAPEAATAPVAEASATPKMMAAAYGAPVTVKKAASMAKLDKKPGKFEGKTLRLEGTVANVCQGRGCWIEIEGPNGLTFMAKSLDESVLVPKDCKGQKVIVQGVVTRLTAKGHDHAAHAAEEGHACPAPAWVLATQGVELAPKN